MSVAMNQQRNSAYCIFAKQRADTELMTRQYCTEEKAATLDKEAAIITCVRVVGHMLSLRVALRRALES